MATQASNTRYTAGLPPSYPEDGAEEQYRSMWLYDELSKISAAISSLEHQYPPLGAAPERYTIGVVVYADGISWDPSQGVKGEGLYVYTSQGWHKLHDNITQAIVFGIADDVTLDTIPQKLVNFTESGAWGNPPLASVSPVDGEVTVPADGVYELSVFLYGELANNTNNKSIRAWLDVDGTKTLVDSKDLSIPNSHTVVLGRTLTRQLLQGQQLSLWLDASSSLGAFEVHEASLKVERLNA